MKPVLFDTGLSTDLTACDNVIIELHASSGLHALVASATGLLHKNGIATVTFPVSTIGLSSSY